jgi:hypothetical protein
MFTSHELFEREFKKLIDERIEDLRGSLEKDLSSDLLRTRYLQGQLAILRRIDDMLDETHVLIEKRHG